ncbi:hypothetical protein T4A_901 [Trichinella pseudospiralis]|uniref:Uncharacterized protein n=1 Tax=Trichinella pseudospiralis TaxID=6337 RepID=A0A0V1DRZ0_TRIPS|nr:hypothetical protein T4A_901 [Trichinella pseudospiralis]
MDTGDVKTTSLSHCGGLLFRVDDPCCPTLSLAGDDDAVAVSSLGVVATAVCSSEESTNVTEGRFLVTEGRFLVSFFGTNNPNSGL